MFKLKTKEKLYLKYKLEALASRHLASGEMRRFPPSPHEGLGFLRIQAIYHSRSHEQLVYHPVILVAVLIFLLYESEASANLPNIEPLSIITNPARPTTTWAKSHAGFLWIKPFSYLCFVHRLHPPLNS